METDFDVQRFEALLDRHGAEPHDWPAPLREHALTLLASSDDAKRLYDEARLLDDTLDTILVDAPRPLGLKTRILANTPQRDPWLDWFTVRVWRPVVLGCLPLAVGFAVGANFADDPADLEDQVLIAFADADTLEALALVEDE
ncbi:MAG: hypothetical protein OXG82_13775 [Gammaproteobacteria bacterium]|nr:hypothetical protein [Gammaproteobacteria bacterium]